MAITSLAFVKEWLRIDDLDTTQDNVINALINSSEKYIQKYLGQASLPNEDLVKVAVCQMVAGSFEHRQDKSEVELKIDKTVENRLHILRTDLGV